MTSIQIIPRTLHFKQPAGTSRGVYRIRNVRYLIVKDDLDGRFGIGECAPLPTLSCDDIPDYDTTLAGICRQVSSNGAIDYEALRSYPSMLFGLETAFLHLHAGSLRFHKTPFSEGKEGIPINGLIWMGSFDEMYRRIEENTQAGFRCIKVKIGAIDFDHELELLAHIRRRFPPGQVELRVDANGAFTRDEALHKLEQLARFGLHSIEQPIRAGQWKDMARLCSQTPVPIALDEELIGINDPQRKAELLDTIRPQYIILKPSLHGGLKGADEWIALAQERNIRSWATSALESNVGLNSIAQWCASLRPTIPQGLGTGMLFTDNIPFPLRTEGDCLRFLPGQAEPDWQTCFPEANWQGEVTCRSRTLG